MPRRLVSTAFLLAALPASGAEWTKVREITPQFRTTSRGLAYGRGDLFFSERDAPEILRLSTSDASVKARLPTPRPVGALAFDAVNDLLLAATYDAQPPVLYEIDLAGNILSTRPLAADSDDNEPTFIDGLELIGDDLYYSSDIGTRLYVADRATLTVRDRISVGGNRLSGHARAGTCLFSGSLVPDAYQIVRSDLLGNVLSVGLTGVIGPGAANEFPPEDLAFDADTFPVPVLWVNLPWVPRYLNPIWAVEVDGCGETCTAPPPPGDVGNTLLGVRSAGRAEYSWRGAAALRWHVVAEGVKDPTAPAGDVTSPAWGIDLAAAPFPFAAIKVREFNCLGQEGP